VPIAEGLAPLRRRLIVPAYRSGCFVARHVPQRVADAGAHVLARVMQRRAHEQRRQAERHQRRISPELDATALDRRVDEVFDAYARYWVSMFRLQGASKATIDAGIDVDGAERIDQALSAGNGAIMAMPHVGAWDHGGAWVGVHWPLTIIAERVEPPELFEWFCRGRLEQGMRVVPLDAPDAGATLLNALRRNEVVGLLCDRDIAGGGVDVEFFGERTTLPAGPATLSLRTGAPLLPNAVYQRNGRAHGVIRPPIAFERTGKFRADVAALTQLLAREFEGLIRAAPEQWHVLQPNWPSDRAG
jgi:KDO2-lipid IV(A) lauroyltransferase